MTDPHHHGDHHDHHHGHEHHHSADASEHPSYYQVMEIALRELLIEKGVFTADDVRREIEVMDSRSPANGARVVARAWTDPGFKARLLESAPAAIKELGFNIGPLNLVVLENTREIHNLIVCTLCSCYPRALLGVPPDWYKSHNYRSRAVREPRSILREFGTSLPEDVEVRVHDSTADLRYLVLPLRPQGAESMTEDELAKIVTRDCMIGVTVPQSS